MHAWVLTLEYRTGGRAAKLRERPKTLKGLERRDNNETVAQIEHVQHLIEYEHTLSNFVHTFIAKSKQPNQPSFVWFLLSFVRGISSGYPLCSLVHSLAGPRAPAWKCVRSFHWESQLGSSACLSGRDTVCFQEDWRQTPLRHHHQFPTTGSHVLWSKVLSYRGSPCSCQPKKSNAVSTLSHVPLLAGKWLYLSSNVCREFHCLQQLLLLIEETSILLRVGTLYRGRSNNSVYIMLTLWSQVSYPKETSVRHSPRRDTHPSEIQPTFAG